MSYENESPEGDDEIDFVSKPPLAGDPEELVEPGQSGDFNFGKFQTEFPDDVPCDAQDDDDEEVICPPCVPDPEWKPGFNWKLDSLSTFPNIYLDEATCEYVMITEEAISDISAFRQMGLSTMAVMIGDETLYTTPDEVAID